MKYNLRNLVNGVYTDEQRLRVKEVIANNTGYLMRHKILSVGIESEIVKLTKEEIEEYYNVDNESVNWLTEVDSVIAEIITALSRLTERDIKSEYESALVLDKSQPEFDYLVNEVEKYLSSK